jgi:hypothetical protein
LTRQPPDFCSVNPDRYTDLASWKSGMSEVLHANEQPIED